jgi:hypothetical protein
MAIPGGPQLAPGWAKLQSQRDSFFFYREAEDAAGNLLHLLLQPTPPQLERHSVL